MLFYVGVVWFYIGLVLLYAVVAWLYIDYAARGLAVFI